MLGSRTSEGKLETCVTCVGKPGGNGGSAPGIAEHARRQKADLVEMNPRVQPALKGSGRSDWQHHTG
eukprot:3547156-Rhodomonas_salina.1